MEQILKRLEIIKNAVVIEDNALIASQIGKLKPYENNEDLKAIIALLQNANYYEAIRQIESYLSKNNALSQYIDKELQSLKIELKALEFQLQELTEARNEYLNIINDFNIQYNKQVGGIIKSILALKQKLYEKKLEQSFLRLNQLKHEYEKSQKGEVEYEKKLKDLKKKIENTDVQDDEYDKLLEELKRLKKQYKQKKEETAQKEKQFQEYENRLNEDADKKAYEETKKEYKEFHENYKAFTSINKLNKQEAKALKMLYREVVRLCHPDIVPEALKSKATEFLQLLNRAYEKKDLEQIRQLYNHLKKTGGFHTISAAINNKEIIRAKIIELKTVIKKLKQEIEAIKNDETYKLITEIDDYDHYFEQLKKELLSEKSSIEEELKKISEENLSVSHSEKA